ncbi:MAG: PH domain-containing protein [Planctomycetota bacterium]|jgi:membrane protein YdbS with pleckstrin-like domain
MPYEPTKECPLCGEHIAADAVKCRFCREFLEDDDGLPISHHARSGLRRRTAGPDQAAGQDEQGSSELLSVKPSLWGLMGFFITAAMFMAVAVFLTGYADILLPSNLDAAVAEQIRRYTGYAGMALGLMTILMLLVRAAQLKSIRYEVSPDRIEFSRGIFSRKIDNMDMFRVTDLKLHRSLLDCVTGVGTVTVVTKDETDPLFDFEKVANPKQLYDIIKKASLEADRKQGVVHLD